MPHYNKSKTTGGYINAKINNHGNIFINLIDSYNQRLNYVP